MQPTDEQPTPVFTRPPWCTVDHEADGYLRHGHVIRRTADVTEHWHPIEYWQATVLPYKERVEPAEVHLADWLTKKFYDPEHLRVYAEDLLDVADKLDKMNGYPPS